MSDPHLPQHEAGSDADRNADHRPTQPSAQRLIPYAQPYARAAEQPYADASQQYAASTAYANAEPPSPRPPRRMRWWTWMLAGAAALIVLEGAVTGVVFAAGGVLGLAGIGHSFSASGSLHLTNTSFRSVGSNGCAAALEFEDIKQGAVVTVTSTAGKKLATGTLAAPVRDDEGCDFRFTVPRVPDSFTRYGVEVAHRGIVDFSKSEMRSGNVRLALG